MGSSDVVFRWRKSTRSGGNGQCVEVGRAVNPVSTWRKSSRSGGSGACIELAHTGAVRDSKHPRGPILRADLDSLLATVKAGQFDR